MTGGVWPTSGALQLRLLHCRGDTRPGEHAREKGSPSALRRSPASSSSPNVLTVVAVPSAARRRAVRRSPTHAPRMTSTRRCRERTRRRVRRRRRPRRRGRLSRTSRAVAPTGTSRVRTRVTTCLPACHPQPRARRPRRPRQDHPGRRHAARHRRLRRPRGPGRPGDGLQRPGARAGHHHPGQGRVGPVGRRARSTWSTPRATPTSAARSSGRWPWSTACCCWSTPPRARCPRPATCCRRRWPPDLPAVVVLNKVDRQDARADEVLDEIYQLFLDLDADDEQHRVPDHLGGRPRGSGDARASACPAPDADLTPLFEAIVDTLPGAGRRSRRAAAGHRHQPRRLRVPRSARRRPGRSRARCARATRSRCARRTRARTPLRAQAGHAHGLRGHLPRSTSTSAAAGDLFVIAGFPEVEIGDTIADPVDPKPLPRLVVDEPVLRMTFGVNTSPLAGKDGHLPHVAPPARAPRPRGARQRVDPPGRHRRRPTSSRSPAAASCSSSVLIESMRREGYELQVSRPEVIVREIDGKRHEPLERGRDRRARRARRHRHPGPRPPQGQGHRPAPRRPGRTIVSVEAPSRGLIGFRSLLLTATRGTALHAPAPRRLDPVGRRPARTARAAP